MEYNIPFNMRDALPNLYDHWIARDLLAYLRAGNGHMERANVLRFMNRPVRYISRDALETSCLGGVPAAAAETGEAEAAALLEGGSLQMQNFGQVHYYQTEDLVRWAPGLEVRQVLGVRIFFGLPQDNAAKEDPAWQQAMLRLEAAAAGREPYRQMAFFHHVLLRPRQSPPLSHKTLG